MRTIKKKPKAAAKPPTGDQAARQARDEEFRSAWLQRIGIQSARAPVESNLRKARQAAGRAGARVRWEHMAQWHQDLEQLRSGFKNDGWRLCFQHLLLRYIFLWRSGGKTLPPYAEDELVALASRMGTRTTVDKIAWMVRSLPTKRERDSGDWDRPMIDIRWSWRGLRKLLDVTYAEWEKLEIMKRSQEPERTLPPRTEKLVWRRIEIERIRRGLCKRGIKPSLRHIQAALKEAGIDASIRTISLDLSSL
jgi:hypothetical protein